MPQDSGRTGRPGNLAGKSPDVSGLRRNSGSAKQTMHLPARKGKIKMALKHPNIHLDGGKASSPLKSGRLSG